MQKKEKKSRSLRHSSKHHRRPRSIGGSSSEYNISYIKVEFHNCWHVLYGNMNAYQICEQLEIDLRTYRNLEESLKLVCKFINGKEVMGSGSYKSKKPTKRQNAFSVLFKNKTIPNIIAWINNVFLDPSYHFYLVVNKKPLA